jgi:hypothetical protein
LQNSYNNMMTQRGKNNWAEKGLRTAGSAIGAYFGGSVGAGVGNLVGGGVFDLFDNSQETSMDVALNEGAHIRTDEADKMKAIQDQVESMNKKDNLRHISEPIKAYGTSMMMAELGTPGVTGTEDAAGNVIKSWDEMSYLEKATRSGKDMVKESGSWKETGKGMLKNLGFGKDKITDKVKGNASNVDDVMKDLDVSYDKNLGLESSYGKDYGAKWSPDGGLERGYGNRSSYTDPNSGDLMDYKKGNVNLLADTDVEGFTMNWLKEDMNASLDKLKNYVGTNKKRAAEHIPTRERFPMPKEAKELDVNKYGDTEIFPNPPDNFDVAPVEVIPTEDVNEVIPDLGFKDDALTTAYGQQDVQIYYNDLINSGYTPAAAEKEIGRWGNEWRFGQKTKRTEREFGSGHFGEQVGKIDSNKYKDIVSSIGDDYKDEDFNNLGNRINPLDYGQDWMEPDSSSFTAMVNDSIEPNLNPNRITGQDYIRAQKLTNKDPVSVGTMNQGTANNMIQKIMYEGTSGDSTVEDLYSLYNHGQLEGWSDAKMNEIGKLIRKKNKGK